MATPQSMICKGCWCQMRVPVPIRGPLSLPLRLFGIKPSRMNPNLCTVCELMFKVVMRRRNIQAELTILFVDLRGYTALSQTLEPGRVQELLDVFYDECAGAIWEHDGLLNKTIGDAVMAIFNFPIARPDHARQAVTAARDIRRRCSEREAALVAEGFDPAALGLGIGVHTGIASFGEFGRVHKDFTAIGETVNLAARLQGAARPGEVLASAAAFEKLDGKGEGAGVRACSLKGYAEPVAAYLM
jgi:adenylate cyclase